MKIHVPQTSYQQAVTHEYFGTLEITFTGNENVTINIEGDRKLDIFSNGSWQVGDRGAHVITGDFSGTNKEHA